MFLLCISMPMLLLNIMHNMLINNEFQIVLQLIQEKHHQYFSYG
jgi:hypothetical protein